MFVIRNKKFFLSLAGILVAVSFGAVLYFGLNFGIEFTGGSMLQVSYEEASPELSEIESALAAVDPERSFTVQRAGDDGYIIRTAHLAEDERGAVVGSLTFDEYVAIEDRFSSIGPSIGEELQTRAWVALSLVSLAIILFIAYVFRRVSRPVSSWKYGVTAIVALLHDIIIPVGVFAVLGFYFGAEIDVLFVTALLAILGFSVNDTIVVFDRIRENLRYNEEFNIKKRFSQTVGESLQQTYVRSVNTSLTTLLVLGTLFFIGPSVTQFFALVLMIGVIAGTYSSIFLASPILVTLEERQKTGASDPVSQ